jgi:hypothetical protein
MSVVGDRALRELTLGEIGRQIVLQPLYLLVEMKVDAATWTAFLPVLTAEGVQVRNGKVEV